MTVVIEVRQNRTLPSDGVYRVSTEVIYSTEINASIFVYDRLTEEFSHVAYPYDMEVYPVGKVQAELLSLDFYRDSSVQKDFSTPSLAYRHATYTLSRVEDLAKTYQDTVAIFVGSDDHTYRGDE